MAEGAPVSVTSNPMMGEIDYRATVGVDFGTHGTAVAFKLGSRNDPRPETKLGDPNGNADDKTPTTLLLDEDFQCVKFGASAIDEYIQFGEEMKDEMHFCEKFKMALFDSVVEDDIDESGIRIKETVEADNGVAVPTRDVLMQSLLYIFKFVLNSKESMLLSLVPDLDSTMIQWVLTVPAIWSEKAKKKMREAAREAGMTPNGPGQLLIAQEPECASIVIQQHVAAGQVYVLVDAGGGTIDIACHKRVEHEVDGRPESRMIEVFPPTGGNWGSTYIDVEFGNLLAQLLGDDFVEDFKEDPEYRQGWVELMREFAAAKENAKDDKGQNMKLPNGFHQRLQEYFEGDKTRYSARLAEFTYRDVTGGISGKLKRPIWKISSELWEKMFGVVLDPITNHLMHLLDEPELRECSQIVLVGGFGGSDRLHRAIERMTEERARITGDPLIGVYKSLRPNLAVVQGAAEFPWKRNNFVRLAQRTYGVESLVKWDERLHGDDEWKVNFQGVDRYRKGFKKFITIGDLLPNNHVVEHKFRPAASSGVSVNIYSSLEENPSSTLQARKIGTTFVDFEKMPASQRDSNQVLTILFHFGSTEIHAELRFQDGETQVLDCDFDDNSMAAEVAERYKNQA